MSTFYRLLPAMVLVCSALPVAESAPTAVPQCNHYRTGFRPEPLRPPYPLVWTYRAQHKPRPAWQEPAWEVQRIDFDYSDAVSAANGLVHVASSSEHAVLALDMATGETTWRFFTDGPVRLAPEVSADRIFFSSDDGYTYCLDGKTGDLIWRHRPPAPDERLVGNEQIISRWPGRSGVLVDGDRAYTTFGMWSPEGIVVTCLNSRDGTVIWRNDTAGTHYMTQPHYEAMGGVSPQGYLALADNVLVVPCGRAMPAFFDARTGDFLYHESEGLFPGGSRIMVHDGLAFVPCEYLKKPNPALPGVAEADISDEASLLAVRTGTREEVFHLNGALKGIVTDDGILNLIGPKKLLSVALADIVKAAPNHYKPKMGSSEGHTVPSSDHIRWETPVDRVHSLVQAGDTLIAGKRGKLTCYDATTGRETWEATVPGDVLTIELIPRGGGSPVLSGLHLASDQSPALLPTEFHHSRSEEHQRGASDQSPALLPTE